MKIGDTFVLKHLWVIVAETNDGGLLAFNFTSFKNGCDTSCVAEAGDHPFLVHKSTVIYASGKVVSKAQLANASPPQDAPVSPRLLKKVQLGALKSNQCAEKFQVMLKAVLGGT